MGQYNQRMADEGGCINHCTKNESLNEFSSAVGNETQESLPVRISSSNETTLASTRENSAEEILISQKKSLRDFKCGFKDFTESLYGLNGTTINVSNVPPSQVLPVESRESAEHSHSEIGDYSWSENVSVEFSSPPSTSEAKYAPNLYKTVHQNRMHKQSENNSNLPSQSLILETNYSWSATESEAPSSVRAPPLKSWMGYHDSDMSSHMSMQSYDNLHLSINGSDSPLNAPRMDPKYSWSKQSVSSLPAASSNDLLTLRTPLQKHPKQPPQFPNQSSSNASSGGSHMPSVSFIEHKYSWSKDTADPGSTMNMQGKSFDVYGDGSFIAESWNESIYE